MKKLLSMTLAACMMLTMAACSGKPAGTSSTNPAGSSNPVSSSTDPAAKVDYPTKTIKLICPWSAGGGSDQICRAVATVAEKYLGKPVVVENRDGSGGVIGLTEASRAA